MATCYSSGSCQSSANYVNQSEVDCFGFGSCNASSISSPLSWYQTSSPGIECQGSISCVDGLKNSSLITCSSKLSCATSSQLVSPSLIVSSKYNATFSFKAVTIVSNGLYCWGHLSCINTETFLSQIYDQASVNCEGSSSCMNSKLLLGSRAGSSSINAMRVSMYAGGTFSLYNGFLSVNDEVSVSLFLQGYYSGYGLVLNCSGLSSCTVYCYGNSCVNLNVVCGDHAVCLSNCDCSDSDCFISEGAPLDAMFHKLESVIHKFEPSYSILDLSNSDWTVQHAQYKYYNSCDTKIVNYTVSANNANYNSHELCYLASGNSNSQWSLIGNFSNNARCDTAYSCIDANLAIGSNIYVGGYYGARGAFVQFGNFATCQGWGSCDSATLKNGNMLVCEGREACQSATIVNVDYVVGLGYSSLSDANIIFDQNISASWSSHTVPNASEMHQIYLLGYQSGMGLRIDCPLLNCVVYCQNNGCSGLTNELFCMDDYYLNSSAQKCFLATLAPTTSPTRSPTHSPTDLESALAKFEEEFQVVTEFLAICLAILALLLICISNFCHRRKLQKQGNRQPVRTVRSSNIESNIAQDGSDLSVLSQPLRPSSAKTKEERRLTLVDYVQGPRHVVILLILLSLYDVYTDVVYAMALDAQADTKKLYIFLISLGVTVVTNIAIMMLLLGKEFDRNAKFFKWFKSNAALVSMMICVFTVTDVGLIATAFTSFLFGHNTFRAPMSMDTIVSFTKVGVISIIVEHIPQIYVEATVFWEQMTKYGKFNVITLAALVVSVLDLVYIIVKVGLWTCARRRNRNGSVLSNRGNIYR